LQSFIHSMTRNVEEAALLASLANLACDLVSIGSEVDNTDLHKPTSTGSSNQRQ